MGSVGASTAVTVRRGVRRGVTNIIREPGWGMSLGALVGVLVLAQMLILVVFAVHAGLELLRQSTDLRLEILSTASNQQIQELISSVRSLPYVDDVLYITKEQALERQRKRDPELVQFLATFAIDNPFPETLGVRLKSLAQYPAFVQFLRQPLFAKVVDPSFLSKTTDQEQQVQRLTEAVATSENALLFLVGFLVLVMLFIVIELVRRRAIAKREELFVEQLVGAGRIMILLPFWTEMIILLLVALLISIALAVGIVFVFPSVLPSFGPQGMFATWFQLITWMLLTSLPWLAAVEVGLVVVVAILGTFVALRSRVSLSTLPLLSPVG
jgi:cell division transport system permease protein